MKRSTQITILFSCLMLLIQCSTDIQKSNIIKIEPAISSSGEVLLSKYASSIEYIAIESQEGVVLPGANSISLKEANNDLFLCNVVFSPFNEACYRYTSDGKYLNSIGIRGNAPSEFVTIVNIDVDSLEKVVKVYDMQKLVAYDFSGNFLYNISKDSLSNDEATKCVMGGKDKSYTYKNHKEYSVITEKNDTIRNIDKSVRYILDFGSYKVNTNEQEKLKLLPAKYFETNSFVKMDLIFHVKEYPNLTPRNRFCEVIFDKTTGQTKSIITNDKFPFDGFTNDLDGGAPFWPTYTTQNKMYQIIDAITFIDLAAKSNSQNMKNVAEKLTENSNPVIVAVTLN